MTERVLALERTLARHSNDWMALPGVVGTGIGLAGGTPCLTVLVAGSTVDVRRQLPQLVDGFPVRIVQSGPIRPRRP